MENVYVIPSMRGCHWKELEQELNCEIKHNGRHWKVCSLASSAYRGNPRRILRLVIRNRAAFSYSAVEWLARMIFFWRELPQ